jgi:hypothetical protein
MAVRPAEEVKKQVQVRTLELRPEDLPHLNGEKLGSTQTYHRSELLWAALEIAKAVLNSPRHQTLNAGFAKQCVEFAEALEVASGQRFDPD